MSENNEKQAPETGGEETMKHIVTEEDVNNNPGEGLVEGEEIEIPVKGPIADDGAMAPELPNSPGPETEGSTDQENESKETKNAAGESPTKAEAERKTEEPH
jgi:hypothetical protein